MNHESAPTDHASRRFTFRVLRCEGRQDDRARFDTFELDAPPGTTVLTALQMIQQEQDPSLAFRFSCRGAVCGSCGMTINGRCGLACRTQVALLATRQVVLEPLPNLDVLRDLVVDMTPFWEKYRRVRPWLQRAVAGGDELSSPNAPPIDCEFLQTPREARRIEQYVSCILCACCYGACPVLKRQPDYVGPAALARLERFMADTRDGRRSSAELADLDGEDGLWGCDTVYRCIDACPKDVRPTDAIAALRRRLIRHRLTRGGRPCETADRMQEAEGQP